MQLKIIQIALGWKREKIFPRSVQLDKIKTQNTDSYKQAWTEMGGRRETQHLYKISKLLFWGLGMPILPCCTPFDLREALLCSLTCALPICPLTIQTPIMAREAHPQYMAVPPCMTKMTGPTKTCPMRHTFAPFQPFCRYAAWSLAIIAPGYINPLHHGTCIQHGYWICRQSEPDILPTRDRP